MKKPLDSHQKDQFINFLANSQEVESIASARLANRRLERSKLCAELKQELPKLVRARGKALDELARLDEACATAREAHRRVAAERHIAYVNAGGADSTYNKFLSRTERQLAELADPRILILKNWVSGLENKVRCAAPEFVIEWRQAWNGTLDVNPKAPENKKAQTWFERADSACRRLIEIENELHLLCVSDYGEDLADRLTATKQNAAQIAATVIPQNVMQVLMADSPDMGRLPLMY